MYPDLIDKEGKWIPQSKEVGQTLLGIDMGLLWSLNPSAKQDLNNSQSYFEITKPTPPEDKVSAVITNDEASYEAYRNTGNIAFLPKENNPKLKQKIENDKNSILKLLTEYQPNIASLTDDDFSTPNTPNETSFKTPDVIGESLTT